MNKRKKQYVSLVNWFLSQVRSGAELVKGRQVFFAVKKKKRKFLSDFLKYSKLKRNFRWQLKVNLLSESMQWQLLPLTCGVLKQEISLVDHFHSTNMVVHILSSHKLTLERQSWFLLLDPAIYRTPKNKAFAILNDLVEWVQTLNKHRQQKDYKPPEIMLLLSAHYTPHSLNLSHNIPINKLSQGSLYILPTKTSVKIHIRND